jgi:serine/threonine-protein phosphatase 2A regulatory subunit A
MAPSFNLEVIRDSVLQTVLALVNDPIPNIRFNVAKSLETLAATLSATGAEGQQIAEKQIVPAVESLKNDNDADVRYFANRALEKTVLQVTGTKRSRIIRS